jgi:hypothetical protein
MPKENEDLFGKVCVCSVGRPFIVTGKIGPEHNLPTLEGSWSGLGLDGKGTACSSNPCIIAESGQEFHDKLVKRFSGKMSYNG